MERKRLNLTASGAIKPSVGDRRLGPRAMPKEAVEAKNRANWRANKKENPNAGVHNSFWRGTLEDKFDLESHPEKVPNYEFNKAVRPRLEDPQVYTTLLDTIRLGSYPAVACRMAGISYDTLREYIAKGQKGENQLYYQFWLDMRKAEAEAEVNRLSEIVNHAKFDWRAGMEILARRFPERWARRDYKKVEIDGDYKVQVRDELAQKIINDPSSRELARRLLRAGPAVTIDYPGGGDISDDGDLGGSGT